MSELLLAGFLVVSELGGDGGHVSRIQTLFSLSQLQARGRTSAYVTPHTSPSSTRKRSWASSISTVSDARLQTGGQLISPRLPDRRETHPVLPALRPLRHATRHRRWVLSPVHLRESAWKRAAALCNWWPPPRPHPTHRNRPQDARKASNQTRLRFFRPHPAKALEARPATPDPRTERGMQGQGQWLESLRIRPGGCRHQTV